MQFNLLDFIPLTVSGSGRNYELLILNRSTFLSFFPSRSEISTHETVVNTFACIPLLSMEPRAAAKKIEASVVVPSTPVRVPRQWPLAPSVTSERLSVNSKGDNQMIP